LWNIARTAAEIAEHLDVELGGSENGLVAYYSFNEGSGNMAHDQSTPASNPDTNRHHAHLLGHPKEMWHHDELLSAFTNSKQYCKHCHIAYTAPAQLLMTDSKYETTPVRFDISPSQGPIHGGTVVTISGRGFLDSPYLHCRFQGAVSRQGGQGQGTGLVQAEHISSTEIRCISPAHTVVGEVALFVTNDGETFNLDPQIFEYSTIVPIIHGITVEAGPLTGHAATYCPVRTPLVGGTTITIHGRNFMQSDTTKLLRFRMGEMPALPVHDFINSTTILIQTPPLHSRFWGDTRFADTSTGAANFQSDAHATPESYAYASPFPMREMRSGSSAQNDFNLDPAYPFWGQGKPFDCSRDAPGSTCSRPAFTVRVTNDGGRQWSNFPPYRTSQNTQQKLLSRSNCVLYSDLIVSPDGDDETGDGTLTRPFETLIKAATWAHGEGDRILLFQGSYAVSQLHEILLSPKKLTVYQDVPLRSDQGGVLGKPLLELCKCRDTVRGKSLCKCEQSLGQPFIQNMNTFQQRQHSDHDESSREHPSQHPGIAAMSSMLQANGHIDGLAGEVQIDIPEALVHTDFMSNVDTSLDE